VFVDEKSNHQTEKRRVKICRQWKQGMSKDKSASH